MSERTSGEGYVEAVDDAGEPDAGEDVSGREYVDPTERGVPVTSETGTGYTSAVDGHGELNAGEDASREGYVEKQ